MAGEVMPHPLRKIIEIAGGHHQQLPATQGLITRVVGQPATVPGDLLGDKAGEPVCTDRRIRKKKEGGGKDGERRGD